MIQDIKPHIFHNEYHPQKPCNKDWVFIYQDTNIILKKDCTFYTYEELNPSASFLYLFGLDERNCFLSDTIPEGSISLSKESLRMKEPRHLAFACISGWQLYQWLKKNRYCGVCGHTMESYEKERALLCPHCHNLVYPRIDSAVIVGVCNAKHQLLVTKYSSSHGSYHHDALVAGYVEIGETLEECVKREVKEETGLEVINIRYYASQPWSFSGTLLTGFFCKVAGDDTVTLQEDELKTALWKTKDDTYDLIGNASLTSQMIQYFRDGNLDAF